MPSISVRTREPSRAWTPPFVILLLLLGLPACGDDDPTGNEDGEAVTVEGTITGPGDTPRPGLFVHLVYGPSVAPTAVAQAESDADGDYSVTGSVPADQCFAVQVWVLTQETFSAAAAPLAREVVGECGTTTLDIQIEGTGPEI
jgi:hypothetical protein